MMADFNHFAQCAEAIQLAVKETVKKVAFDAQANIQAQIVANDQVDTGFMLNSVYTVTGDGSTYTGGDNALPEVGAPEDAYTAYVAVGALYGIYQEMGTRYLPSRPFFIPGIEATRPGFDAAMAAIKAKLEGGAIV